jgi:RNA polymerase sigma factor (sigma-70 family)
MATRPLYGVMKFSTPDHVRAALAGESGAAEGVIADIWPSCFRLATVVLGDRTLAQDAAQEACVIVHRKIRGLRDADAFDAWVYRIVLREAQRARRRFPDPPFEALDGAIQQDAVTGIDVWAALQHLTHDLREVVVLFYFDDLKGEEIARILRVPHATVRNRLMRAKQQLRGLLDDYSDTGHASTEVKQYAI